MEVLLIQGIGAIGYTALALSYYRKKKIDILFMQIIAYIFFSIHYYLLDAITGTMCNLLGLIAITFIYLVEKKKDLKRRNIFILGIIPILVLIALLTYENMYSILPIFASVLSLISFLTDEENTIRGIGIISAISWLIYAIIYKSYVAIVFEIITARIHHTGIPALSRRQTAAPRLRIHPDPASLPAAALPLSSLCSCSEH